MSHESNPLLTPQTLEVNRTQTKPAKINYYGTELMWVEAVVELDNLRNNKSVLQIEMWSKILCLEADDWHKDGRLANIIRSSIISSLSWMLFFVRLVLAFPDRCEEFFDGFSPPSCFILNKEYKWDDMLGTFEKYFQDLTSWSELLMIANAPQDHVILFLMNPNLCIHYFVEQQLWCGAGQVPPTSEDDLDLINVLLWLVSERWDRSICWLD